MAPDEALHLAEILWSGLPNDVPIFPSRQHFIIHVEHCHIDLRRSHSPGEHEHDLRLLLAQQPRPGEETRHRDGLGHPAVADGHAHWVPVDRALALGEELDGRVEGEEDAAGKGGQEACGGSGTGVLVLDHEREPQEKRGEAAGEGRGTPGGDEDVGAEAMEVQRRGEERAGEAGRDGGERVGGGGCGGGFERRGGGAEEEGVGMWERGVELVGERERGVDVSPRAAAREGDSEGVGSLGRLRDGGRVPGTGEVAAAEAGTTFCGDSDADGLCASKTANEEWRRGPMGGCHHYGWRRWLEWQVVGRRRKSCAAGTSTK